jgi:large subunit ribosomal protein L4
MLVPLKNMQGEKVDDIELRPDIFEVPVNVPLMHQAFERQMANMRAGTHKARTRSENNRSKSKWYRQKGTGRARHGSRNAPIFVGGGVAHGPLPRSYRKKMPRKMRRGALRSALAVKAADQQLVFVDQLTMDAPKTKRMVETLRSLEADQGKTLLLLADRNEVVERSARNLQSVMILRAQYLNIRDLLSADMVVIPLDALAVLESILGVADVKVEEQV